MSECKICTRCGMHFMNGVAYPSFINKPRSAEWVAEKVCQFAHAQDGKHGDYANGCINPSYNRFVQYAPLEQNLAEVESSMERVFGPEGTPSQLDFTNFLSEYDQPL